MNAEIVNLKKYRKQKARADKERKAAANRAKHGRTRRQEVAESDGIERAERELSGKRLDSSDSHDEPA